MIDEKAFYEETVDDDRPTFAQLPRETREIIEMRGRRIYESLIPTKMRLAMFDTAKNLDVPIDVVVLACLNSFWNATAGKFPVQIDGENIPHEKQDFSSITPFKKDFERTKDFFDSVFDKIQDEIEEWGLP